MVMIKIFFLFIFFSNAAMADEISLKDGMQQSISLREKHFYREDIKLNQGLIKKYLKQEHLRLIKAVKANESVDRITPELQKIYLIIYADYYKMILHENEPSPKLKSIFKEFSSYYKLLEGLEVKVREVDKINDKAIAHIKSLEGSVYKFSSSFYIQYLSWQEKAKLDNTTDGTKPSLIITNKATCLGGDIGVENEKYHFYLDGCAMIGAGTVTGQNEAIYGQSSLPLFGVKLAPGLSFIPTSSNSRIGFKLPIMYSTQKIDDFDADGSSYVVKKKDNFFIAGAIYSRWYFSNFFLNAELGKFLAQPEVYWAFGLGISL
jgi:hypothetical protein